MRRCCLKGICCTFLALVVPASVAFAGDRCHPSGIFCRTCGEKVCVTTAKPGKEEKHCWEVECTEVCIPAVRFPWECGKSIGCDGQGGRLLAKCGKVRCVRKLKKVDYECDTCEYEHRIVPRCPECDARLRAECVPR